MNIAIFASAFYPHFGGVEEACRHLALEFNRRGHRATVITIAPPADLPAQETVQGIEVWRFPFEMPSGSPSGVVNFARHFPGDLRGVVTLLKTLKIDVIHVQCVGPNGFYALWAAQVTGLPLVVTTQGERTMDAGQLYRKESGRELDPEKAAARADYVTACSEQTLDDAKAVCRAAFGRQKPPGLQWHCAGGVPTRTRRRMRIRAHICWGSDGLSRKRALTF